MIRLIFPDPESLIRRSQAAGPLLDAVKDKKTRDAVRSVIERLTGGGAKPAAPDAAATEPAAPAGAPAAVGDANVSRRRLRSVGWVGESVTHRSSAIEGRFTPSANVPSPERPARHAKECRS